VSITLQPDERSGVSTANGILYQMSGSTEVALDGEAKMLNDGEGLFIAGGKTAALTAGSGGPSTFLHSSLLRCGLGSACRDGACRRERIVSHSKSDPRPQPGGYDLNLTRVTFPATDASNRRTIGLSNAGVSRPDTTNSQPTIWRSSNSHQSESGYALMRSTP